MRHDEIIDWVQKAGVTLRGDGVDEAPQCYKRIEEVLAEHKDTVGIKEILKPVIVCMAGENEMNPYKD